MGNLLSLYTKIHRLWANTKEGRCLPNSQRNFVSNGKGDLFAPTLLELRGRGSWHSLLYGLFWFCANKRNAPRSNANQTPDPATFGPVIIVATFLDGMTRKDDAPKI